MSESWRLEEKLKEIFTPEALTRRRPWHLHQILRGRCGFEEDSKRLKRTALVAGPSATEEAAGSAESAPTLPDEAPARAAPAAKRPRRGARAPASVPGDVRAGGVSPVLGGRAGRSAARLSGVAYAASTAGAGHAVLGRP